MSKHRWLNRISGSPILVSLLLSLSLSLSPCLCSASCKCLTFHLWQCAGHSLTHSLTPSLSHRRHPTSRDDDSHKSPPLLTCQSLFSLEGERGRDRESETERGFPSLLLLKDLHCMHQLYHNSGGGSLPNISLSLSLSLSLQLQLFLSNTFRFSLSERVSE